jgi:hypothetical protein
MRRKLNLKNCGSRNLERRRDKRNYNGTVGLIVVSEGQRHGKAERGRREVIDVSIKSAMAGIL